MGASLNDPAFITQTINYANNDGIRWCVLTNGLLYRIYKSDELTTADKKLLAEADLRRAAHPQSLAEIVTTLSLISKESVSLGFLDEWGRRKFVDTAVRAVLDELLKEPSSSLVNLVRKSLGEAKYTSQQIRDSLTRIGTLGPTADEVLGPPPPPFPAPSKETAECARTLKRLLAHRSKEIRELFHQIDDQLASLQPGIERSCKVSRITYWISKKRYAAIWARKDAVVVDFHVPLKEALTMPGAEGKEIREIGDYARLVRLRVRGPEDLDFALKLALESYSRVAPLA